MKSPRVGRYSWSGGMTPAAVLLALAALAGSAKADNIIDAFVEVNIYYGVAQLYSPTDVLLSTTESMTVETQFSFTAAVMEGQGAFTPYFMPLMDPSVVAVLADDPVPAVPAYITTNLPGFENGNGFGTELDVPVTYTLPDPNTSPTPSAIQLYQTLTTQSVSFVVSFDSGYTLLGPQDSYVAVWGPFGPLPGTTADTIEGGTPVDIFERDISLQEIAAPEPASFSLFATALGLIMWKRRTTRASRGSGTARKEHI